MFERFTDRARRVVVLAQEEAKELNHNYIGTEHILLGLIHEGEGVAAKALEALGISLDEVREQVKDIIGMGQQQPTGHVPFTPRARKVLELALREALQLGHNYIGTEHILLGLIREGEGVGAQVLIKLGGDLNRVRQVVIQLLSGYAGKGGEIVEPEESAGDAAPPIEGMPELNEADSHAPGFVTYKVKATKISAAPILASIVRSEDHTGIKIKLFPPQDEKVEILDVVFRYRDGYGTVHTHGAKWPSSKSKKPKKVKPTIETSVSEVAPTSEEPVAGPTDSVAAPMPASDLAGGPPFARPTPPLGNEKHMTEEPAAPKAPPARQPRTRTHGGATPPPKEPGNKD
jgi:hypothetical protein